MIGKIVTNYSYPIPWRSRGLGRRGLGKMIPYHPPLPWENMSGLGEITGKKLAGAALILAGAYFVLGSVK